MASVEVFVDDAVRGHLPPVCVRTGAPADGKLRREHATGGLGAAWVLLFFGPLGWLVLSFVALSTRRDTLTVRLPYSAVAVDRELHLVRVRLVASIAAAGCAIAAVVGLVLELRSFFVVAAVVAFMVAAIAHVRLAWSRVTIRLDASHRWVTLSGVHPAFARAVEDRDSLDRHHALGRSS